MLVPEVLVEVVLEVLDEVHVVLNEVISSDSWESESIIVEFPCVNANSWLLALGKELVEDDSSVVISFLGECSRQVIKFDIQLFN